VSTVIKADVLGSFGSDGVYVIDPKAFARRQVGHVRVGKSDSPEKAAHTVIDQANLQAAAIISAARDEAEVIRRAAYEEGRAAAAAELERERAAIRELCSRLEAEVEQRQNDFWTSIEPDLIKLAVEIARKITRRQIEENETFVLETVRAGLRQLRDRRELKIHVNPEDFDLVRSHKAEIMSSSDGIHTLEVIDDRRVDRGGCIIESGNGHLDGRVETQLAEVERTLLEACHDGRNENAADA